MLKKLKSSRNKNKRKKNRRIITNKEKKFYL
jgi:hypothetical protein